MAGDIETFSYPHKTADYTYRVPTPPRIIVPPPALNNDSLPDITLDVGRSASFLSGINYNNIITQNAPLDWTYERRREAQMVLPYLYLGPMTAAKDEAFLRGEKGHAQAEGVCRGITLMLGIKQRQNYTSKLMTGALKKAQELGVECRTVDLASNQDLIRAFPQTTALINDHLSWVRSTTDQLGKVLVFCESGNERSAGVLAAYLMEVHTDVDYIKAMQLVQAQRFCANFDDAMKRLLQGYWDILCARRQVDVTGMYPLASSLSKSKRVLARDDDDEMEDADGDDAERFDGRSFAPFVDQPLA